MKKSFLLLFVLVYMLSVKTTAQQYPFYTQYMANPYMINPGFVANSGRPEINLTYRQQWTGFEDGPKTIQGDFQLPLNKRISLGVQLLNDRTILLSQFNGYLTFGYRVSITSKQHLSFGLSGGVVSNQLMLDDVPGLDLNDPVVANAVNNFDFDGQFGVGYSVGKFSLGFSLLKLVKGTPFYNGESFEDYEFDPFKDKAAFITYRFDISKSLSFEPYFLYRTTFTGFAYYEGTGLLNIGNKVSIGGGYRTDFGPLVMLRFKISKARIGYSYDFPSSKIGGASQGTNEVQLKWLFGEEPIVIAESNTIDSEETIDKKPVETETIENQNNEPAIAVTEESQPTPSPTQTDPVISPSLTVNEDLPTEQKEEQKEEIAKPHKWYLIVGTFEKKYNAERLVKNYHQQGIHAEIKTHDNYYYVHIPAYSTDEITVDKVLEIRRSTPHTDAWFKQLE